MKLYQNSNEMFRYTLSKYNGLENGIELPEMIQINIQIQSV